MQPEWDQTCFDRPVLRLFLLGRKLFCPIYQQVTVWWQQFENAKTKHSSWLDYV